MKESSLLNIAIFVSVIGIIVLYIISNSIEINDITIQKITNEEISKSVKIKGKIKDIRETDSVTFIVIEETSEITGIVFDKNLSINKGDIVEITGKVEDYKGKQEIIIDHILLN